MEYKFQVCDRVVHVEEHVVGTIVELTTLQDVTEGDCEGDDPWYVIVWDHEDFEGQESEYSLEKI